MLRAIPRTEYPQEFPRDGGTVDLTTIHRRRHEDFAVLVEALDATFAWSAVARPNEGDLALMLKTRLFCL